MRHEIKAGDTNTSERWAAAISATARKLTIIIWNMVLKAIPYSPPTQYEFPDQKRKVIEMKSLIHKFNIITNDLGLQL